MIVYLCPVCRREARKTPGQSIYGHFDKAWNHCPGSSNPFYITVMVEIGPDYLLDYCQNRRLEA